jgi:hypothetical protein
MQRRAVESGRTGKILPSLRAPKKPTFREGEKKVSINALEKQENKLKIKTKEFGGKKKLNFLGSRG